MADVSNVIDALLEPNGWTVGNMRNVLEKFKASLEERIKTERAGSVIDAKIALMGLCSASKALGHCSPPYLHGMMRRVDRQSNPIAKLRELVKATQWTINVLDSH
ncbi:hypothetical protein GCK32_016090 [Trichostrongylus colubriformis]|uniref:Uncharacterized protein n=1 Tax=Trichostrongylus colubriformis TaxID=6319 RepID=A0AAN8FLD6_TRICO